MSESQTDSQNIADSEGQSECLQNEADDDKRESENDETNASKSENTPVLKCDEPDKNVIVKCATKPLSTPQLSLPETEAHLPQSRAGECNLLPVLVERLRSALELSCPSQNGDDQLPLEDSGVDSEEDLRIWASNLRDTDRSADAQPTLNIKLLEDLLLSDIHTALGHLRDTLKRFDIKDLTRYNSSLDSVNKLHLLRLISNLIAKLKIPEEKPLMAEKKPNPRRSRADRHTIGVSTEELARARKWLENNRTDCPIITKPDDLVKHPKVDKVTEKSYEKVKEKHQKDAINQQQVQTNKRESSDQYDQTKHNVLAKSGSKDDLELECESKVPPTYYNPSCTKNKFMNKKAKIKRANTIDIPNYLSLQSARQNGCVALRRPIDISDKLLSNITNTVIPSFEPKTDNDRKFLALINKNSDSAPPTIVAPFKTFSFRQNSSLADKNWNNRFSHIKTSFDKPKSESERHQQRSQESINHKFENKKDESAVTAHKSYNATKPKVNGFRHAPTSPFQKIEKTDKEENSSNYIKYGYMPKSSASTLKAKVKLFDHRDEESPTVPPVPPPRTKGPKFNKDKTFPPKTTMDNQVRMRDTEKENHHPYRNKLASNRNSFEGKQSDQIRSRVVSLEGDRRRDESRQRGFNENIYQNVKRNSVGNCSELQKRFSHPGQYEVYPINIAMPEQCLDNRLEKSKQSRVRRSFEESYDLHPKRQELRPSLQQKSTEKADVSVRNVAVQTGNENLARPKEDRVSAGYNRQYPEKEARTLCNNASVQTLPDEKSNYTLTNFLNDVHNRTPVYNNRDLDYLRQCRSSPTTGSVYSPVASISSYHSVEEIPEAPLVQPKFQRQEYVYPGKLSLPKVYPESPDQYNHYYPEPERHSYYSPDYSVGTKVPRTINRQNMPAYSPPLLKCDQDRLVMYDPTSYSEDERKIQNQDISSEGVVTRYAGAVGTIATIPASPEPTEDRRTRYGSQSPVYNFNQALKVAPKVNLELDPYDEVQRHNMLQRSLMQKLQNDRLKESAKRLSQEMSAPPVSPSFCQRNLMQKMQTDHLKESAKRLSQEMSGPPLSPSFCQRNLMQKMQTDHLKESAKRLSQEMSGSPVSPSFCQGKVGALKQAYEQPVDGNTQDKGLFEDKRNPAHKLHFRPVKVPGPPRIHVPPSIQSKFIEQQVSQIQRNASPVDSSDEYLMSCAAKPSRSIVLSKSESWHQLAMSKSSKLQLPPGNPAALLKPPKPKSPMRFTKQYEASASSDNMKKMEEKVQQYFHGSSSAVESKTRKRQLTKKAYNALAKSHTMPQLHDEKIFDDNVDVDKAFDSLFKEATCAEDRC